MKKLFFIFLFVQQIANAQVGVTYNYFENQNFQGDSQADLILFQPNNKIIVAGNADYATTFGDRRIGIFRYNANGTIDRSFGANGYLRFTVDNDSQTFLKIITQDIANNCMYVVSSYNKISKLSLNGILDTSFGVNGTISMDNSYGFSAKKMEIQTDGSFIIYGSSMLGSPTNNSMKIYKYLPTGVLDNSFGANGLKDLSLNDLRLNVFFNGKCYLQPDGKYIVSGSSYVLDSDSVNRYYLFLKKFNNNGTVDASFGTNGKILSNLVKGDALLEVDTTGSIIVIGNGTIQGGFSGSLLTNKFDANGNYISQINPSFSVPLLNVDMTTLIKQNDGKVLIGGNYIDVTESNGTNCYIARLLPNGNMDTTFGQNGIFKVSLSYFNDKILKLALSPTNQLFFAGAKMFDGNWEFIAGELTNEASLKVIDTIKIKEILISPNPCYGKTNVSFSLLDNQLINMNLYDANSRIVREITNNKILEAGSHLISINVSDIAKGLYFVKISNSTGSETISKLVVY